MENEEEVSLEERARRIVAQVDKRVREEDAAKIPVGLPVDRPEIHERPALKNEEPKREERPAPKCEEPNTSKKSEAPAKPAKKREGELRIVHVDKIIADEQWNVRGPVDLESDDHMEMVGSLEDEGVVDPLTGWEKDPEKHPGMIFLVSGFRRFAGLRTAGIREMPVLVLRNLSETQALLANLLENVAKRDVASWRVAQRCIVLEDEHGLTKGEIAKKIGLSLNRVRDITKMERNLCPKLLKIYHGEHASEGSTTQDELFKLCSRNHHDQMRLWSALMDDKRALRQGEALGERAKGGQKRKNAMVVKRLSSKKLERALAELPEVVRVRGVNHNLTEDERKVAEQVLRWTMGLDVSPFQSREIVNRHRGRSPRISDNDHEFEE